MAWTEGPVVDATLLAIEEINARGGILGREVLPVVVDGRSEETVFARHAEGLIAREEVCTIFGCWTSASRKSVLPLVEKKDHLLVYPTQYEGMEQCPNIFYTGAAPNQQIVPAVQWAFGFLRKKRFFLVGWNSVYSRAANAIIRDEVEGLGGEILGEEYVLPDSTQVTRVVRTIAKSKPDVIFNSLVGDTNLFYTRLLRAAGISPEKVPTVYFSIGEIELQSLSTKRTSRGLCRLELLSEHRPPREPNFCREISSPVRAPARDSRSDGSRVLGSPSLGSGGGGSGRNERARHPASAKEARNSMLPAGLFE